MSPLFQSEILKNKRDAHLKDLVAYVKSNSLPQEVHEESRTELEALKAQLEESRRELELAKKREAELLQREAERVNQRADPDHDPIVKLREEIESGFKSMKLFIEQEVAKQVQSVTTDVKTMWEDFSASKSDSVCEYVQMWVNNLPQ